MTIPPDLIPCGSYPTWQGIVNFNTTNPVTRGAENFFMPLFPDQQAIDIYTPDVTFGAAGDLSNTGATVTFTMNFWADDGTTLVGQFSFDQTGFPASGHFPTLIPEGTTSITHVATNDMTGTPGSGGSRSWNFNYGYRVYCPPPVIVPPAPKVLDMADTPTKLYLVGIDGSAWMWNNGARIKLAIDMDGRQMAGGMLAVDTAGEAAIFCDWNFHLWATGQFYHQNDVTDEWELISLTDYMVPVDITARGITLMGPHGIGPSYMNDTALWIVGKRSLWGLGPHLYSSLMNGVLPSSPNPIAPPREGAFSWASSTNPDAVQVHQFSYRGWGWRSLATSNLGAYAQFERRAGTGQPYGQMIG